MKKITDIKNKNARNFIRGAISARQFDDAFSAMEEFRRTSNYKDAKIAYEFLRNAPLANEFPFPEDFPSTPSKMQPQRLHKQGTYFHELAHISARTNAQTAKLLEFIRKIDQLNQAVAARDIVQIRILFDTIVTEFGYSLVILKKAISIRDLFRQEEELAASIDKVISAFTSGRRSIVAVGIEDLMDRERDYTAVRTTLYRLMNGGSFNEGTSLIISDHLAWHPNNEADFYKLLQAYGNHSLVDVIWFLQSGIAGIEDVFGSEARCAAIDAVPASIRSEWERTFVNIPLEILKIFEEQYGHYSDFNLFRCSPAWFEYRDIVAFRFGLEAAIGERFDRGLSGPAHKIVGRELKIVPRHISEIVKRTPSCELDIAQIDPASGGNLAKIVGFIEFLRRTPEFKFKNGEEALRLLSMTSYIARLLTWDEIAKVFDESTDDLSRFLSTALKKENSPSSRSEHAFRKATERIAESQYQSSIIELVRDLHRLSPELLNFCIVEFDEIFLSKLFKIIQSRSDAIQTRVGLLNFYASATDDSSYNDRASALNAEAKLALVRADLDEIRIAVDTQKLDTWINENLSVDIRPLSKSASIENLETITGEQIKDTRALYAMQSVRIADLCDKVYKQFCTNQFWGIDSYVGRRIRHGTLEGMMLGELRVIINENIRDFSPMSPRFVDELNTWLSNAEISVAKIGDDLLRVRSEAKPNGAFYASITDPDKNKLLNTAVEEITKTMIAGRSARDTISLLSTYCWSFLQIDLDRLKVTLDEIRTEEFVLNRQLLLSHVPPNKRSKASKLLEEIDKKTLEIFKKLSGWLTRPSIIQPTASILELFEAVVAEIHEYAPAFVGKIEKSGDLDVEIFSGRYHHVYDILNVLVANAAKHGPKDGSIRLDVKSRSASVEESALEIRFLSEAGSDNSKDVLRIKEALIAPLENALVQENFSGIRKARHIVENNNELSNFQYHEPHPNFHVFSFHLSVPNV